MQKDDVLTDTTFIGDATERRTTTLQRRNSFELAYLLLILGTGKGFVFHDGWPVAQDDQEVA